MQLIKIMWQPPHVIMRHVVHPLEQKSKTLDNKKLIKNILPNFCLTSKTLFLHAHKW
jgi:hypothetical protein